MNGIVRLSWGGCRNARSSGRIVNRAVRRMTSGK
jgi:hypothetical protein